ncbi:hypothetical protein BRD15_02105, partial [Halobacteriales archaeon SW_6_65_15]
GSAHAPSTEVEVRDLAALGFDRNLDAELVSELAPPDDLLSEFKTLADERDDLHHDEVWDEVDFGERYRDHLRSPEARQAMGDLLEELESRDGDLWLVCYENTDEKRCHRTILKSVLRERVESSG